MVAMAENEMGTDTPKTVNVPDRVGLEGLEEKLNARWAENGVYAFDPNTTRNEVFSIDTPPPTASGSLHVGHVFSYTQTDVIARFMRMCGKNVFYPMGWDDNGLPTERRVQNYFGVRTDTNVPYDPNYQPPEQPAKNRRDWDVVSRQNFIELCLAQSRDDEVVYEQLFTQLGLSVDWDLSYRTIDAHSREVSQRAFLQNLADGHAYNAEAPTMWDVSFQTAVAQAELEDKEVPGAYYRYAFSADDGSEVFIETTRPELLPACSGLVAHPDDDRYKHLFGKTVTSPLFDVEVEVYPHELAQPDKGAGIAMVCTFGDQNDITWWRELQLPTRTLIGRDGRFGRETPEWITSERGTKNYAAVAGKTVFSAQKAVVEMLEEADLLDGEPEKITHAVNFFEKGDKPLEIVTSRQWYLRNGGRDAALRQKLTERGNELQWHPGFMQSRYTNWVENLTGDWLVSRQRVFGVAIPLWYRIDDQGNIDYDNPIIPSDAQLPVDPVDDVPEGFSADQRDVPGGFSGDPDVLDTWATSSLTPQIIGQWSKDDDYFAKVFPFDLRPQGHDIIRTWLFSTVVRADQLQNTVPWKNTALSGWVLDPQRQKMSKSKGNVVVPSDILDEFGSDAVRYWAASARLGSDTAYEVNQMKIGRRLAIKLLNASKFALNLGATQDKIVTSAADAKVISHPLDQSLLAQLHEAIVPATRAFEKYDYARTLNLVETFFWHFTDDYIELIKDRAYGSRGEAEQASVVATLATALDALLKLLAPFLPFATDEVWSWWRSGSVHEQAWPGLEHELTGIAQAATSGDVDVLTTVTRAISRIRKAKSDAKVKQRTEVVSATITATEARINELQAGLDDLRAAGNVAKLHLEPGDAVTTEDDEVVDLRLTEVTLAAGD